MKLIWRLELYMISFSNDGGFPKIWSYLIFGRREKIRSRVFSTQAILPAKTQTSRAILPGKTALFACSERAVLPGRIARVRALVCVLAGRIARVRALFCVSAGRIALSQSDCLFVSISANGVVLFYIVWHIL